MDYLPAVAAQSAVLGVTSAMAGYGITSSNIYVYICIVILRLCTVLLILRVLDFLMERAWNVFGHISEGLLG